MFISSLKVITISAPNKTSIVAFTGEVSVICGAFASWVVKVHGFGVAPATRLLSATSFAAVILNV